MVESTTIKITNVVKEKLLALKVDNEGYSVIIANLLNENEKLKEDVAYLKEEKKDLYKLALRTSDSVALIKNNHKATYVITKVLSDKSSTNEEQLQELKEVLSEMLKDNPEDILVTIRNLKEMLELEEKAVPEVLLAFEKYVKEKY